MALAPCTQEYHNANLKAEYDARGIFLCYVCDKCRTVKLSSYRADVLDDPNYWHDEPIDHD